MTELPSGRNLARVAIDDYIRHVYRVERQIKESREEYENRGETLPLETDRAGQRAAVDRMTASLRIYADFNSSYGEGDSICWCLCYGSPLRSVDDLAEELGLRDGMAVILYYEDESEEFEVSAVLMETATRPRWHARADWNTRRQLRG